VPEALDALRIDIVRDHDDEHLLADGVHYFVIGDAGLPCAPPPRTS
jgi:hypothetical protein